MQFHIWASRLWILDPIWRQLDDFKWYYVKSVPFTRYLDGINQLDSFAKGKSGNKYVLEVKIGQMNNDLAHPILKAKKSYHRFGTKDVNKEVR